MPLSQIIPPSPSPHVSKSLCFMSASPFLLYKEDYQYHLSRFHIFALLKNSCLSFSDLHHFAQQGLGSATLLELIQMCSFFFFNSWVMFHSVPQLLYPFNCQWTYRFFHVIAIVNSGMMNIGVLSYGFLKVYAQQWDSCVVWQTCSLLFKKSPYFSPQWLYQFTFPAAVQEDTLFPTPSPAFIVLKHFDDGHSNWYGMLPHCSFDLHFSTND